MVRVNIIDPKLLSDQHLVAEYVEILMLVAYIKKYPELKNIPENYTLATGHMRFFKNKVGYLKKRHELLKKEMKKRGFATNKKVILTGVKRSLIKDWKPSKKDKEVIKKRLTWKIKNRPNYHRYYGEKKSQKFFIDMIKKG